MLEVKNLTKVYGKHVAVNDLSFKVEDGQIYGFLGPNGAGKSTTMNIITGCLAATEGTVTVDGHDICEDQYEAKKCIGYLPELPPLYLDMTAEEYLTFVARAKKIKKSEILQEVARVTSKTNIVDVKDRLMKNLSKGYKQRVGIAQALIGDPKLIILDEPTVGLDPKQIIEIRELIKELGKTHTVILSSHILTEVNSVCDHVMIISKGKLVASDTPDNLAKLGGEKQILDITVRTNKEEAFEIASQFDENVVIKDSEEKNAVDLQIVVEGKKDEEDDNTTENAQPERDIRDDIFHAFASQEVAIIAMNYKKSSLEEIFLELTKDEDDETSDDDTKEEINEEDSEFLEDEVIEDPEDELDENMDEDDEEGGNNNDSDI
jgi:ABC-2 type transport system ATP-binding protein